MRLGSLLKGKRLCNPRSETPRGQVSTHTKQSLLVRVYEYGLEPHILPVRRMLHRTGGDHVPALTYRSYGLGAHRHRIEHRVERPRLAEVGRVGKYVPLSVVGLMTSDSHQ